MWNQKREVLGSKRSFICWDKLWGPVYFWRSFVQLWAPRPGNLHLKALSGDSDTQVWAPLFIWEMAWPGTY
jgi:hypothetical protein